MRAKKTTVAYDAVAQRPSHLRSDRTTAPLRKASGAWLCAQELGGYFIVNGNERMIRMLIMPRRNHVLALQRSALRQTHRSQRTAARQRQRQSTRRK